MPVHPLLKDLLDPLQQQADAKQIELWVDGHQRTVMAEVTRLRQV